MVIVTFKYPLRDDNIEGGQMKKHIMICSIILLLLTSSFIGVSKPVEKEEQTTVQPINDGIDWWPMFKHDSQNTGYSSSITAPSTNMIRWTFNTNMFVNMNPVVINDKVYIGSNLDDFYCLDADTGSIIWIYNTLDCQATSACVVDGKVYIGTTGDYILCLDAETGELIWNFYKGWAFCSNPVVAHGKVYIRFDFEKKISIYCLDADTGDIIWDYFIEEWGASSPAVYNGKLYIGHTCGYDCGILLCFDAVTGEMLWNFTTGYFVMSSPSISNGKVYSGGNGLHCLDAETGEELWTFPAPDGNTSTSPTIAYGRIYYLGRYGKIFCLDAETGEELWNYTVSDLEELIKNSPAIADGKIYTSIWSSGKLLCLDAYTGEFIWDYKISSGYPSHLNSGPVIAEGRVYVGSRSNCKIYCFEDNSGPPSEPIIYGPTSGKPGIEYDYTFNSTEPDGDGVYYFIDWGDGNDSGWNGPYQSEVDTIVSNIWLESGSYIIRAKTKDIFGAESDWSEFEVSIPRTRLSSYLWYQWFQERFPILKQLLEFL